MFIRRGSKHIATRAGWLFISLLAPLLLLMACHRASVTPTPVQTPASTPTPALTLLVTPSPTPVPTSTPGVAPAATPTSAALPPPVTVDLSGKISDIGILLEDVVIASSDGRAKMTLPKGGRVLDTQGRPPEYITCIPMMPQESNEGLVVGLAYDFVAPGTGTIASRPAATLVISYDPPPANPRIDLDQPDVACWWDEENVWVERPPRVTADLTTHTLQTVQMNLNLHLVVMFWYLDTIPPLRSWLPAGEYVGLTGKIDETGTLLDTVPVVSGDNCAKLTLPKGAKVLDAKGQPAKYVTCTVFEPASSEEGLVVGLGYNFGGGVVGGTVTPEATLVMTYEPPPANPRIDVSKPDIAVWSAEKQVWVKCPSPVTADLATCTLTGSLANFGSVVVIYWYTDVRT
jgi:hypothetical protein